MPVIEVVHGFLLRQEVKLECAVIAPWPNFSGALYVSYVVA